MPVPNTFATATSAIPLSQLDTNFATAITLGNTAIQLGNTVTTLNNMTLANVTVTSGNSTVTKETVTTITSPTATALTIQSAGTTAVTIDTSQNVTLANQLKVNSIYDASGGSNAQLYGVASPPNSMGFRNRLLNPGMVIDQRNAGASVTGTNSLVYPVDRWASFEDTDGVMTFQRSTVAPAGFSNSVIATTTTADTSLSASQRAIFLQRIEGFNIADLGWGTANAQTVTLSFWVRSSLTGTFGGSLTSTSRSYPFSYSISAANTWEQKTITIAGDTSGTWDSTNGLGLQVTFGLGCGSNFNGTAGAWVAGDLNSTTGAVSVIGTLNATWQITGVQLEAGTVASPFERRDYGRELMMCQRYFEKSYNIDVVPGAVNGLGVATFYVTVAGTAAGVNPSFAVSKRAAPTITLYSRNTGSSGFFYNENAGGDLAGTVDFAGTRGFRAYCSFTSQNVNISTHFTASAEL